MDVATATLEHDWGKFSNKKSTLKLVLMEAPNLKRHFDPHQRGRRETDPLKF